MLRRGSKMATCLVLVPVRRKGSFSFSEALSQMVKKRRNWTMSLTDALLGTGIALVGGFVMGKHTLFLDEAIVHGQAVIDQHTNLAEVPLHLEEIVKDEYENKSDLRPTDIDKYPGLQLKTSKFGKLTPFLRRFLEPEAFGNLTFSIFGAMIGLPYHFRYLSTNELNADWRNFLSYLQKNGLGPKNFEESKNFKLSDETKSAFVLPPEQNVR